MVELPDELQGMSSSLVFFRWEGKYKLLFQELTP